MKVALLAVAVLATIAISSAVDEDCVQRKLRGLPMHWPNPSDCSSFYRCTNKSVKRHILCPAGKEYNIKSGRCGPMGKNLCMLSLRLAVDETLNSCTNALSGTYVADSKNCRNFYICNNNMAYPQLCDAGSYFNDTMEVCMPDTKLQCWENFCLDKESGSYIANENDCYSFYICNNKIAVAQKCSSGSYFDKETMNCRPGTCPADATTATTTTATEASTASTERPEASTTTTPKTTPTMTTATTTITPTTYTSTPTITTTPRDTDGTTTTCKTTTTTCSEMTTTPCDDDTTPKVTTPCDDDTTPKVTTPSDNDTVTVTDTTPCDDHTTPEVTTPCDDDTTPEVTTPCDDDTTPKVTTPCDDDTTPKVTTPSDNDTVTVTDTTPCDDDTTPQVTTPCDDDTTPKVTTPCDDDTTPKVTTPSDNDTVTVTDTTPCDDDTTPQVTTPCDDDTTPKVTTPSDNDTVTVTDTTPCDDHTTPEVTTPCDDDTTPKVTTPSDNDTVTVTDTTPCDDHTTPEVTTPCDDHTTPEVTTPCDDDTTPKVTTPSDNDTVTVTDTTPCDDHTTPEVTTPCDDDTTPKVTTPSDNDTVTVTVTTPCDDDTVTVTVTTPCDDHTTPEVTTPCDDDTTPKVTTPIDNDTVTVTDTTPSENDTTAKVTTPSDNDTVTVTDTTPCDDDTTPKVTTPCDDDTVTVIVTTPCDDDATTPEVNTPCDYDTTPKVTTPCDDHTTPKVTTPCDDHATTPPDDTCAKTNCDQAKCVNAADLLIFPALNGNNKFFCMCISKEAVCRKCPEGSEFLPIYGACFATQATHPAEASTTAAVTAPTTAKNTTSTPGSEVNTKPNVTTPCEGESCSKCDQGLCQNAEDHSSFPLPDTNTAYCVCIDKKPEYRECAEGTTYNTVLGICTPEAIQPRLVTCQGDIKDGDFVPNPRDCMLFFICFNGELVEGTCGTGNFFNAQTKSCTLDTNGICSDQPAKSRSKRSVIEPQSDNDDCCPGGYHNGDVIPHPTDCDKNMVCCDGEFKEESCGKGFYFNAALKKCLKDENNVCWPTNPTECISGHVEQHPSNCSMYIACCHGVLIEKSCDQGYYFAPSEKECVKDTNNICWPKDPACDGGIEEGQTVPIPGKCASYLKCCHGVLMEESCGNGMIFSSALGECVTDVGNECWPKEPACDGGIDEGDKVPNAADCASYLVCTNGKLESVSCGHGMMYNSKKGQCVPDTDNECWPKEPTCDGGIEEGQTVPIPGKCASYLKCCHGVLMEESCENGMIFSSALGECVTDVNNECWPKEPTCEGGVKEGDKVPNAADCASYLVCTNGKLESVSCGHGMMYNSKKGQCEPDTDNECWPKDPACDGGIEEGQTVPIPGKCASYLKCCHGVLMEESCGNGMIFSSALGECVTDVNNECWPKEPTCEGGVKEGDKVPNAADCASYLVCTNGKLESVSCGHGMMYNSKKGQCEPDTDNECWPKDPACDGGIEEGQTVPIPGKCASYLKCCHGVLMEESCGNGMIFSSALGECVTDVNNECWPKEPTCEGGVKEGDKVPNAADCASYLVCTNGKLESVSCGHGMMYNSKKGQCVPDTDNECWPKEPTCDGGIEEGQTVPIPGKCASYLKCCHGVLMEESCENGMIFSSALGECVTDVNNECWPKEPTCEGGVKEGDKVPNAADCASYLECTNGKLESVSCGHGMMYNSKKGQCVPDTDNECWPKEPTCDGGIEEGQTVPIPGKCASYLKCCHGVLMEESCENGMIFSSALGECVTDVNNECWPKEPTCEGGVKEGDKVPNAADCASYLVCTNGKLESVSCGHGMMYNSKKGQCVPDTDNECWPKEPTCDGGIEEGQTVPIPGKCASYLKCCHGVLMEESCENGMIFSSALGECVTDVNNECWPKESTCEVGVKDGDKVPNTADCASYLICSNGKLESVSCGHGMMYNSKKGQCDPDTDNECWPKEPTCDGGIEEGQTVAIPGKCASYLKCCHGVLMEESCENGMIFSSALGECVTDVNNECWPKEPTCEGGVKDGDKVPNTADCASYLICSNGKLESVSCGHGMMYNSKKGQCVPDTDNECWPKEPTCDGGIEEGQTVAIPGKCASYLKCCHGVLMEESCENGMIFSSALGECVTDVNNECWPQEPTCEGGVKEGDKVPNAADCASYLVCTNGKLESVSCGHGMMYNSKKGQCVPDTDNECWPKEPTCDGGIEEGQTVAIPGKCASYLKCCHGVLMEESCENGMIFSSALGECVTDVNNECWPKEPTCEGGVKEGDKVPNAADCASYLVCTNGKLESVSCGHGMMYNSKKGQCVPDTDNECWPKEPTCDGGIEEGQTVPIPGKCASYLKCCHGVLMEESCENGMIFSSALGECVTDVNNECWPKEPTCEGGVKEGDKVPNAADCASYLVCTNGKLESVSCGHGMMYNSKKGQCVPDTDNECWPKEPTCDGGIEEGQTVPIPGKCASYLKCCHGVLMEESCENGMIFSSALGECVTDVNNECWPKEPTCEGGVKDGDKVPNTADCASYLICSNGKLESVSCGHGMMYNSKKGQCDPDTDNECWPKEPTCDGGIEEGQTVAIPGKCASYLKCCHGVLMEESCENGMIFSSALGECVTDVNNECWPKEPTCEGGVKDGDKVPNTADCASYLICSNGKLESVSCGHGMMYNSKKGQCEPDTDNECWPKEPTCDGGIEEGQTVAIPGKCASYLKCCHGVLMEESCENGMIFSSALGKCVTDVDNECWPKEPTCEGGVKDGDKVPNTADCASYLICSNGKLESVSCGHGMMYNSKKGQCEPDTDNECWPKEPTCDGGIEEGQTVAIPGKCASYFKCCHGVLMEESCENGMIFSSALGKCVTDVDNECWPKEPACDGGIEEGQTVPIPGKCASYLKCCHGVLMEESCGKGMFFDSKTNQCQRDEDNTCWPKDTCKEGQQVENEANCSSYFKCCGGKFKLEFCDEGLYFKPDLGECTLDVNNICWLQKTCTCSGGYEDGETSPAADCDKYYTCSDGVQVLGECGINMYYNATCGTCIPDTERKCWPNYCADQPNGAMVKNPKQCNAFYLCNNGESTDEVCETGHWFNPAKSSCQPDLDAECYNPCACQDKIKMLPHPDCTKFYFCNGNQTIVEKCPVGGFDITIGDCNPQKKCSDNGCEDKPDYYTYADIQDKTKFYLCLDGVPVLTNCLPNTEYNGAVCAHVSDPDCDLTPCSSQEYLIPYATLNGTEENAFCICRKGYATKQYCAADYVFSTEMEACYSDAPCDPMMCNFVPDYFVFATRGDEKSFCLCADNHAVVVACPNGGTFNTYQMTCTNVDISTQCDQLECVNRDNYYIYPDRNGSTKGFCMCKDHVGTFNNCSENSYFDAAMGACRLNNIQCDSSKCKGLPNNSKIAALISTQGYCECENGEATYYNCKNNAEFDAASQECIDPLCDPSKCENAADYTQFPAVGSIHGFCMCYSKEVVYKACEEGGVFNTAMLVCQMPLKNCVDSKCVGVADSTKLPADYSIYGYCSCSGGRATFQECQNGLVFDPTSQSCKTENLPIEDVCDTTYCDDPAHAGQMYPSINTIYGYCRCSGSVPTFQPCPNGETFDSTLMSCRPSVSSKCDLSLCADATPNNGYPVPTKTGSSSFCYCTGPGNAMLINCPTDLYYNDKQKKCVATIEEGCSCPGGLQNGNVAPDTNDCSQYYICDSGIMHQRACPSGQYFNTECMKCQADTTGICVKKEACSCLGTYREGERLMHPYNEQMYYVCENKMLQERDCGTGRIFNKALNQCTMAPHINSRHLQKRSVDVDEFYCLADEKRSVPSNCSQYEVCLNHTWTLQSCPSFNYYNPEQMQCLEPRDDAVCAYAKVTNLPKCDDTMEKQLYKGRTCQQYFRCQKGKWLLNTCAKYQYYNSRVASCLPHYLGEKFECKNLGNDTEIEHSPNTCQDLSMRPYKPNCGMYLMCSGNQWWYNYCPLGMYFNRTLSYCLPDTGNVCPAAIKESQIMNATIKDDLPEELCQPEGFLRASALACNRYYICIGSQWKQQICGSHNYYDALQNQCSPDTKGICQHLKADCLPEEKRLSPANCSAYEKCSVEGKWLHWECPQGQIYDNLVQECVANDGICSSAGLRKVCSPQETRKVANNCTQFYYCHEEQWVVDTCLQGNMYWPEKHMCVPYSHADKCKPLLGKGNATKSCVGLLNGVFIGHLWDCTRYFICVNETPSQEMQCASGSFFDTSLEYCRPNDGSCHLPLKGECENATADSLVAHPSDCQSYYLCSSVKGQQLMHCPVGQYYNKYERQCRDDHGECKAPSHPTSNFTAPCFNKTHGTPWAHEMYCNIYYICVKGVAVPMECPDTYQFNASLSQCVSDPEHECHNVKLVDSNLTYSCGNLSDGSYLAHMLDCTRYYICSAGQAHPKKCSGTTYFDAKQLLCVPDDGSCPFIDIDETSGNPLPPDPNVCESRHGNLMSDPANCNNFYVCVNGKLRHDRCYPQFFFNATLNQCQRKSMLNATMNAENKTAVEAETLELTMAIQTHQCSLNRTSTELMCKEYGEGATMAEQGDCRLYVTCEEEGTASSQRCRNGESYDSLLGICRQTDGTCQMDSGLRAGECSDLHGQLARDTNNCRKYFICINGQKITQSCAEDEYFSKSQNICIKDTLKTCAPEAAAEELAWQPQSCNGLSESILYPYTHDNCRSYFQCVKGAVKVQQCADNLYFDPTAIKCVQNRTECLMPGKSEQRSPIFAKQNYEKLCTQRDMEQPYANFENNCHSFYTCHADGEVSHELCPLGMAFDKNQGRCMAEENVICILN